MNIQTGKQDLPSLFPLLPSDSVAHVVVLSLMDLQEGVLQRDLFYYSVFVQMSSVYL